MIDCCALNSSYCPLAPASANLISKISTGQSDSLMLSVLRAVEISNPITNSNSSTSNTENSDTHDTDNNSKIDFSESSQQSNNQKVSPDCILCPAMNTYMWEHPITNEQIQKLKSWGYFILEPIIKKLACHDVGKGAMASVDDVVDMVNIYLNPLKNRSRNCSIETSSTSSSTHNETSITSKTTTTNNITIHTGINTSTVTNIIERSPFLNDYLKNKNRHNGLLQTIKMMEKGQANIGFQNSHSFQYSNKNNSIHFWLFYMLVGAILAIIAMIGLPYINLELSWLLQYIHNLFYSMLRDLIKFIYELHGTAE